MQRVYASIIPIATVVVNEGSDLLESLGCDGMSESGVWGVGVEVFPAVNIVADKVGDCAKDFIWYGGVWGGHGDMRRSRKAGSFLWEEVWGW